MTKLKLLGAQRVKSLTEILERKFKDASDGRRAMTMTNKEATLLLSERLGKKKQLEELLYAVRKVEELSEGLSAELAINVVSKVDYLYYGAHSSVKDEIRKIAQGDLKKDLAAIEREFQERASQLWLVDTLEQAQAIVNTPVGEEVKYDG